MTDIMQLIGSIEIKGEVPDGVLPGAFVLYGQPEVRNGKVVAVHLSVGYELCGKLENGYLTTSLVVVLPPKS